jgi:hypothetical protein
MEKRPKCARCQRKKKIQIARFLPWVPIVSQEYYRFWFSFLLSYLVCNQIWLNHLMNDCHFSYITKLKRNPSWTLSFIGYVAMPIILPTIYLSFDPRYTLPRWNPTQIQLT